MVLWDILAKEQTDHPMESNSCRPWNPETSEVKQVRCRFGGKEFKDWRLSQLGLGSVVVGRSKRFPYMYHKSIPLRKNRGTKMFGHDI